MRVLITGSAGFIGSHLADRLNELDHTVVGVDNMLTGRLANYPDSHPVDVTDRHSLYKLANVLEPELIIHAAASYSDPDLWHRDIDTNIAGAVNIANVARHHGARVVYFQTVLPPTSSYAISKLAAEQYLRLSGVPLLVVRLANVYGPRNLSGPIPTFTRKILAGEMCTIAHTTRDFVYIDTLVDLLCDSTTLEGWVPDAFGMVDKTLTVHSGRNTHIRTIYELVAAELDAPEERYQQIPAPDDDVAEMDFRGVEPVLDCSLSYGIRQTVEWYREHGVGETYTHLRVGG